MATSLVISSISSHPAFKNSNISSSKLHYHPITCFSVLNNNVPSSRKLVQKPKATMNSISLEDRCVHINSQNDDVLYHNNKATLQLYAILETICDRIEMHYNVAVQRDHWNSLLLNSTSMITLAAATMGGVAGAAHDGSTPIFGLKLSTTLLFSAATLLSLVMNKIQPSQLAEEQRNATRLFKQLHAQIQTIIAVGDPTEEDIHVAIEKILALDKAYPLALLGGAMLEKFPHKFEHAVWWPTKSKESNEEEVIITRKEDNNNNNNNGWSEKLEIEMREIIEVVKRKDMEDYDRLGNLALKMNKVMAILGPLLNGIAALGSVIFVGCNDGSDNGTMACAVSVVAGAMASVVNAIEHGGQVGMVIDMYRYCAGFFKLLEEDTERTLEEKNWERRENGEMFEMKMGLALGRNVAQLRNLASRSSLSRSHGDNVDEFASKLF